MSKKIYHIVDPETGKVVGIKRVGRLGQEYYEASPNEKLRSRLLCVILLLMLLDCLLILAIFLVSGKEWKAYLGMVVLISSCLMMITVRVFNRVHKKIEEDHSQAKDSQND